MKSLSAYKGRPRLLHYLLFAVLLAGAMLGCSMLGAVRFDWSEMWSSPIYLNLRLPRIILSVLVGASLSVCGAAYQSVFRNPLTDPYVLGISSGASLGAAIAILLGSIVSSACLKTIPNAVFAGFLI